MSCEISKARAKEYIKRYLKSIGDKYDLDLSENSYHKVSSIDEFDNLQFDLDFMQDTTGIGSLYETSLLGNAIIRIEIVNKPSEAFINSIKQKIEGVPTDLEKANYDKNNYKKLTHEFLKEQFENKKNELRDFVFNISSSLGKNISINKGKDLYETVDADTLRNLRSLRTDLNKALVEQDRVEEFKLQLEAFADYITEVNILSKNVKDIIKNLENDPEGFIKINELFPLIAGHESIIKEIQASLRNAPINALTTSIRDTIANMTTIDEILYQTSLKFGVKEFLKINAPIVAEMEAKLEEKIKRLELARDTSLNTSQKNVFQRKIDKAKADHLKYSPTKERILKVFKGEEGDINIISSYLRAAITNPDIVISGFAQLFKDMIFKANKKMLEKTNIYQEALDKYLKDSNRNLLNTEEFFDIFLEERETFYWDRNENKIISKKAIQLKNYYDPKRHGQRSLLDATISIIVNAGRTDNDISALDYDLDLAGDIGLNKIIKEYTKDGFILTDSDLDSLEYNIKALKTRWEIANLENTFTDEYNEPDKLLDQFIWEDNDTIYTGQLLPKGINKYYYLRDRYTEYNRELNSISRAIRNNKGIPTKQNIIDRNKLIELKTDLRDKTKWTGKLEQKAASILLEYKDSRSGFGKYHVPKKLYNIWETLKNKIDAEGNLEDKAAWYEENVVTKYTNEYRIKQKKITDEINFILDGVRTAKGISENNNLKTLWSELKNLADKHRDRSYIIDGRKFSESDKELSIRLEKEIELAKLDSLDIFRGNMIDGKFIGMTNRDKKELKQLKIEHSKLWEQLKNLSEDPGNKNKIEQLKSLIIEIKEKIDGIKEKNKIDENYKEEYTRLTELYKELAKLSNSQSTKYFKLQYEEEFKVWVQKRLDSKPIPDTFNFEGKEYTKLDDNFIPVYEEYLKLQFENEPDSWYDKNILNKVSYKYEKDKNSKFGTWVEHIKKEPLYIWKISRPNDSKHIIEESPSFAWSRYEVDNKYKNPSAVDDRNYAKLKDFKDYNLDILDNSPNGIFLKFLKDDYKESQKVYTNGKKLGDLVPSIERNISIFDKTKDSSSTLVEQLKRKTVTTAQDRDEELGDTAGKLQQFQPHYFSGPIDAKIVSKNIFGSLLKYSQASVHFDLIQEEILPVYSASKNILEKHSPSVGKDDAKVMSDLRKLGDKVASKLGVKTKLTNKSNTNNRLQVLQEFGDLYIYGERKKAVEVGGYRFDKIHGNLLGLKSMLSLGASPLTGYPFAAQLGNALAGSIQQIIKTGIKDREVKFSLRNMSKSIGLFTSKYAGQLLSDYGQGKTGNKSYFGQITDLYGVFEDIKYDLGDEIKYRNTGLGNTRKIVKDAFFFTKNGMEASLASASFITVASEHFIKNDNEFITDKNGNKINVLDTYKIEKGRLKLREEAINWSENDHRKFRQKLAKIKRDVDGAYASTDQALIQRYWWGAALFWMNKWLVPFFENMYSGRRFNLEEGTHIIGYHRQFISTVFEIGKYLKDSDTRNYNFISNVLTQEQKDSIRQTGIQTGALTTLYLLISLLGYDDEDPDRFSKMKKQGAIHNWALFGLLKGKSEAESIFMPMGIEEAYRKLTNPAPQLLPFASNAKKIFWDDLNYSPYGLFTGKEFLKKYKVNSGYAEKGDIKAIIDAMKLVGYSNSKSSPIEGVRVLERFNK